MNRLLNNPEQVVDEMLAGYIASYPDRFCKLDGYHVQMCIRDSPVPPQSSAEPIPRIRTISMCIWRRLQADPEPRGGMTG